MLAEAIIAPEVSAVIANLCIIGLLARICDIDWVSLKLKGKKKNVLPE